MTARTPRKGGAHRTALPACYSQSDALPRDHTLPCDRTLPADPLQHTGCTERDGVAHEQATCGGQARRGKAHAACRGAPLVSCGNGLVAPFYTKIDHFAKTGSGQTQGKLNYKTVLPRLLVTLLLCNAIANEALPLFLDRYGKNGAGYVCLFQACLGKPTECPSHTMSSAHTAAVFCRLVPAWLAVRAAASSQPLPLAPVAAACTTRCGGGALHFNPRMR